MPCFRGSEMSYQPCGTNPATRASLMLVRPLRSGAKPLRQFAPLRSTAALKATAKMMSAPLAMSW